MALDPAATGLAEMHAEFSNTSASDFLTNFLADEGLAVDTPPAPVVPTAPTTPPAPSGNATAAPAPAAPNGQPPASAPAVDPNQLNRLLGHAPGTPAPGTPPTPAPVPPQPAPAPTPTPQPAADAPWQPFDGAIDLPPAIKAALDHDDPAVRHTAIGSVMAGVGNMIASRLIERFKTVEFPQLAQATVGHVQSAAQTQNVQQELYGNFPQLRHANPALIAQAAQIVTQDELARNPGAVVTPEIVRKIGALAAQALAQAASGHQPAFAPQPPQAYAPPPQQYAPPPGYAPPPPGYAQPQPVSEPTQGTDGNWYVRMSNNTWAPTAPPGPPQPVAPPYIAGQGAGGFGVPPVAVPTPDSEFASFMNNGFG
ncbi:hypothetical protein Kuura_009 [Caulobacter phage Kuura]|nr:hypothetical protein Kuura_009 [Caulobacter phage Kuura]